MKLLIIDGNRERRMTLKRIFQDDFSVTTLSSAQEALAFARSRLFEVVIISETINSQVTPVSMLNALTEVNKEYFISFLLTARPVLDLDERIAGFNDVVGLSTAVFELYKKIVLTASLHY